MDRAPHRGSRRARRGLGRGGAVGVGAGGGAQRRARDRAAGGRHRRRPRGHHGLPHRGGPRPARPRGAERPRVLHRRAQPAARAGAPLGRPADERLLPPVARRGPHVHARRDDGGALRGGRGGDVPLGRDDGGRAAGVFVLVLGLARVADDLPRRRRVPRPRVGAPAAGRAPVVRVGHHPHRGGDAARRARGGGRRRGPHPHAPREPLGRRRGPRGADRGGGPRGGAVARRGLCVRVDRDGAVYELVDARWERRVAPP